MKITETHANGSSITVRGFRAHEVVEAWRKAQSPKKEEKPEQKEPKVTGVSAQAERAAADLYPTMNGSGSWNPTVFGKFVPNGHGANK